MVPGTVLHFLASRCFAGPLRAGRGVLLRWRRWVEGRFPARARERGAVQALWLALEAAQLAPALAHDAGQEAVGRRDRAPVRAPRVEVGAEADRRLVGVPVARGGREPRAEVARQRARE